MPTHSYISVVDKTMRVLEAIGGRGKVPLAEIASSAGLIKSSTFRILFTLEQLGYVEKSEGGRYSLTAQLARLTSNGWPLPDLGNLAEPLMAELQRFRETVNLGILDDGEVLYIRVLESSYAFRLAAKAGMRGAVHSTALGKCLLCRLPRQEIAKILKKHPQRPLTRHTIRDRAAFYRELEWVRSRGYAIDDQENVDGVRCLGAPILTPAGDVRAAISISGPAVRMLPENDQRVAEALIETCGKIARLLGYTANTPKDPARKTH